MNRVIYSNCFNFCLKKQINKLFSCAVKKVFKGQEEKFFYANIKFVSEKEIKELNKKFRNIDRATDVLSFPNYNFENETVEAEDEVFLGDIAICKKIANRQAKEYCHSKKRELCFLALHGFLHLMGFDHIEKEDEKVMMKMAEEILKENGVERWKLVMLQLLEKPTREKAL